MSHYSMCLVLYQARSKCCIIVTYFPQSSPGKVNIKLEQMIQY